VQCFVWLEQPLTFCLLRPIIFIKLFQIESSFSFSLRLQVNLNRLKLGLGDLLKFFNLAVFSFSQFSLSLPSTFLKPCSLHSFLVPYVSLNIFQKIPFRLAWMNQMIQLMLWWCLMELFHPIPINPTAIVNLLSLAFFYQSIYYQLFYLMVSMLFFILI